ncbi:hypothetical protein KP509_18G013100 [Ceratopteris richardii]|uniref:Protein NBR1 homolog n=1 Tax=Ceratopteris richardii TaxID=49495 RepID=A0A8T2SPP7_CERRI|nr:hypothetical protein KP509_18G013100 [Ceratopteris richardii]KAH7365192.1 hypothetical protein KP509_18G013100 [Ceratopteris richardii]
MALVLKIKHKETLRRWVVSETVPLRSSDFSLTMQQVESKVRGFFRLADDQVLHITYMDKEGDVVTVADDQDLMDACIVQQLNPLRLKVEVLGNTQSPSADSVSRTEFSPSVQVGGGQQQSTYSDSPFPDTINSARASKHAFPQATADAIKQFIQKCTQNIDPNLQPAIVLKNVQKAFKEFIKIIVHEGQKLAPQNAVPSQENIPYNRCPSRPSVNSQPDVDENQVVHVGVRCDECNMYPIKGLRYKSTKIFNYDLCSACYLKMGNASDYQKFEKPKFSCHGSLHPSSSLGKGTSKWTSPFVSGSDGWKTECPFLHTPSVTSILNPSKKYDAVLVKELSLFDTPELATCARFTWIICLKNTGSLPWPQGTKFVHIGGDNLGLELELVLKLPEEGLSVGLETDVSVEMRAPEKPGNYIAHWCLMTPCGEKFGQCFWTALQVTKEAEQPYQALVQCRKDDDITQTVKDTTELHGDAIHAPDSDAINCSKLSQNKALESCITSNGRSLVNGPPQSTQFIVSSFADHDFDSDDTDGFSMVEKPEDAGTLKMAQTPVAASQFTFSQPNNVVKEHYGVSTPTIFSNEEMNLHELESMGFKNRNLNAILLQKNRQDLQLTLDDLLLGSGWDNLLKDLEEMGFDDANTNLRLLIKNEGSIKHVVKELMEIEKLNSGH